MGLRVGLASNFMGGSGSSGSETLDLASVSSELGPPFLSLAGLSGTMAMAWVLGRLKWISVCFTS